MRDDNPARQGSKVDELVVDPITSTIYHIERRPAEAGRNVIVHTEKGEDAVGKEWNVRSGVHEVSTMPLSSGRTERLTAMEPPVWRRSCNRVRWHYLFLQFQRWPCV